MRIFTQEIIVAPQHIDIQNRVSNLCYVQWMQDLAINHSTVQGWGVERYEAEGPAGSSASTPSPTNALPLPEMSSPPPPGWPSLPPARACAAICSGVPQTAASWPKRPRSGSISTWRPAGLPACPLPCNRPSRSWQTTRKFCSSCRASRHKRQACLFSLCFPTLSCSMTERDRPLHVEPRKKPGDRLRPFPVGKPQKREADGSSSLCDGRWLHTAAANPWAAVMPQLKSASAQARLLSMP